jgi:predicted deacetylase
MDNQNSHNSSKYIIRFDDICPTMDWHIWTEIETIFLKHDVRPILAVVPNNLDPKLVVSPPVPDFWDRVRAWQVRGWTIALHGYQHVYVNKNPGVINVNPQSEFAGVSRKAQEEKLRRGLEIFAAEGVRPDCWVAPAHSFDLTTVDLLAGLGVNVISDGLWRWPYTDERGVTWVPQQLCGPGFKGGFGTVPPGVWTVCHHHNGWDEIKLKQFRNDIQQFKSSIIKLDDAVAIGKKRSLTMVDRLQAMCRLVWWHRFRPILAQNLKRMRRR